MGVVSQLPMGKGGGGGLRLYGTYHHPKLHLFFKSPLTWIYYNKIQNAQNISRYHQFCQILFQGFLGLVQLYNQKIGKMYLTFPKFRVVALTQYFSLWHISAKKYSKVIWIKYFWILFIMNTMLIHGIKVNNSGRFWSNGW